VSRHLQRRQCPIRSNVSRESKTDTGEVAHENCRTKCKISGRWNDRSDDINF